MIHLDNLENNLRQIRSTVGRGTKVCTSLKANAYGHGAVPIAHFLVDCGVETFGVATVEEGRELRKAGITLPIILYGAVQDDEVHDLVEIGLESFVYDRRSIERLSAAARDKNTAVKVHLKVDSGMGRLGCLPEEAESLAHLIVHSLSLEFEGLCTHFASSDGPGPTTVSHQLAVFSEVRSTLLSSGLHPRIVHTANSGAILDYPESYFDLVRPGIILYGYPSPDQQNGKDGYKPVMELTSRVGFVKTVPQGTAISYGSRYVTKAKTKIAGIGIGYADGYRRAFSNRAPLLIEGYPYCVAGTVCMDQLLVDVGLESNIREGSEVVLFGPSRFPETPTAQDLASIADTIPYEILCGISPRVPRIYV